MVNHKFYLRPQIWEPCPYIAFGHHGLLIFTADLCTCDKRIHLDFWNLTMMVELLSKVFFVSRDDVCKERPGPNWKSPKKREERGEEFFFSLSFLCMPL